MNRLLFQTFLDARKPLYTWQIEQRMTVQTVFYGHERVPMWQAIWDATAMRFGAKHTMAHIFVLIPLCAVPTGAAFFALLKYFDIAISENWALLFMIFFCITTLVVLIIGYAVYYTIVFNILNLFASRVYVQYQITKDGFFWQKEDQAIFYPWSLFNTAFYFLDQRYYLVSIVSTTTPWRSDPFRAPFIVDLGVKTLELEQALLSANLTERGEVEFVQASHKRFFDIDIAQRSEYVTIRKYHTKANAQKAFYKQAALAKVIESDPHGTRSELVHPTLWRIFGSLLLSPPGVIILVVSFVGIPLFTSIGYDWWWIIPIILALGAMVYFELYRNIKPQELSTLLFDTERTHTNLFDSAQYAVTPTAFIKCHEKSIEKIEWKNLNGKIEIKYKNGLSNIRLEDIEGYPTGIATAKQHEEVMEFMYKFWQDSRISQL